MLPNSITSRDIVRHISTKIHQLLSVVFQLLCYGDSHTHIRGQTGPKAIRCFTALMECILISFVMHLIKSSIVEFFQSSVEIRLICDRCHVTWCSVSSPASVEKLQSNKTCLKWVPVARRFPPRLTRTPLSRLAPLPCRWISTYNGHVQTVYSAVC